MQSLARFFLFFFFLLVGGGAYLAYERLASPLFGIYLIAAGIVSGDLSFLFSLFSLFSEKKSQFCLIVGLLCAGLSGYIVWLQQQSPLYDISTDLVKVPGFKGVVTDSLVRDGQEFVHDIKKINRNYDDAFKPIQQAKYPTIQALILPFTPIQSYDFIIKTLKEKRPTWKITFEDKTSLQVEAVAEREYIPVLDDILLVVRPYGEGSSKIEMRSRSRIQFTDFGANANHISNLFSEFSGAAPAYKATLPKDPPATPVAPPVKK